jgi:hypothetical protein
MSLESILTLIIVGGTVWGGLVYFLIRAMKYEKEKVKVGEE